MASFHSGKSIFLKLFVLFLLLVLPLSQSNATRIPRAPISSRRPICPACVCCEPAPLGSCCRCCASPIVTQTHHHSQSP
ncbi:hypothetical protein AtNW77_Chr1g0051401 [Arabidopsis thaliana]|uniref:Transmembrane protein n=3 Tax=Arabidopsis TaxID=3701 RepID=A0A178W909_ARATH|nr:uncharacterized protein AT1G51920 [Arabidopsis thaliana]AEE32735.1 transmembrane protein [Arabidopsis thaliana]KAG7649316.1 hypothetical protein ISN45_At01g043840 [Arabidopsis thaliana x Arabidopsis arenosa]OAP14818.1 hypothetical protein AXX17_AT1G46160 [Arabidopsis thaliana]|eukprot:NP_175604.1 transmembrane protein [Arabidopsis thaliana]